MTLSDDDYLLAGDYVLGTLDGEARTVAAARRLSDVDFDKAIAEWESRILPLDEASTGIDPPAHVRASVLSRIRTLGEPLAPLAVPSLHLGRLDRQVQRWRRIAACSMAIAALMALWVGVIYASGPRQQGPSLIAVLQPADQQPAFLMKADLSDRLFSVNPVAAPAIPGKSYELWIIDPTLGAPKSLGTLRSTTLDAMHLPDLPHDVLTRATYAVTIEREGGSPDGTPSGKPVFIGHLVRP